MKNIKEYLKWFNQEKISILASVLFLVSMLPNWALAFIASPAGDDYYYSTGTHQAWIQTHSIVEVLKAAIETTRNMCIGWNGDWFSVFCFTFMPEAFVRGSYWIFPLFWSFATIVATIYFLYEVLTNHLKFKWYETLMISNIVLFLMYQWMPSAPLALYWHVGVLHYIMPHVVCLLMLAFLAKYMRTSYKRYIIFSILGSIAIGGSSYYSSFFLFLVYLLVFACSTKNNKKCLALILPFLTGITALYFQFTAPGNAARVGENTMELSVGRIFSVIINAIIAGFIRIGEYFINSPLLFVFCVILALLIWDYLIMKPIKYEFKYPLLFVGYMYGIYAALFTPELYADTNVSGGPATMEYIIFIFLLLAVIIYAECWIIRRLRKRDRIREKQWYYSHIIFPILILCFMLIILNKGTIKDTLFWESYEYIVSGQAQDFKEQIDSQMEILWDDSIAEAVVCPMNPEQGPLMCMPPVENPEAFPNRALRGFFGKTLVVAK